MRLTVSNQIQWRIQSGSDQAANHHFAVCKFFPLRKSNSLKYRIRSPTVISPDRAKFGLAPRALRADIQNFASQKSLPGPDP